MPSIVFAGPRRVSGGSAQPPASPPAAAPKADSGVPAAGAAPVPPAPAEGGKQSAKRPSRARKPAAPAAEPAGGDAAEQEEEGEQRGREEAAEMERVRARHEAGAPASQGGQFIGNDPSTPENEAWVLRPTQAEGGNGPAI
jgi:hypothetical protein